MSRLKRVAPLLLGLALLTTVATACSSASSTSTTTAAKPFYLSLGDSYSVGYQPSATGGLGTASSGYTAVVATAMHMQLENFGCGGATTTSITTAVGCTQSGYGPVAATDAVAYPTTTQSQAALSFITAPSHRGRVGLVTISIGGNDVTSCVKAGTVSAILSCVNQADGSIKANVTSLVTSLQRALTAAGDHARVIGLTYPDVVLGAWVYPPSAPNQQLATLSVTAFNQLVNPALSSAYGSANFVNVTNAPYGRATQGASTPLSTTVHAPPPYGQIPAAVGEICYLTYYCQFGNIHANSMGYAFIGKLIVAKLHS